MKVGTREHSYYMAQCYDIQIAYEMAQALDSGKENPERLKILNEKFDHWTKLHNSYENTLPSNS